MQVTPEALAEVQKTTPRPYQLKNLTDTVLSPVRFDLWEQGIGKTKDAIDKAAYLFRHNKIDALLVLAPNGAHYNWVDNELPKHMGVPYRAHVFDNQRDTSGVRKHQEHWDMVMEHDPESLLVLSVSYPALLKPSMIEVVETGKDNGKARAGRLYDFCKNRRVMIVGDELAVIKGSDGVQSTAARALAAMCPYRLGLEGTPVDNGPFDLYAIMLFGDPMFWMRHGIGSYKAFQGRFGIYETTSMKIWGIDKQTGAMKARQRYNKETGRREDAHVQELVGYKNLDLLKEILDPYVSRLTKETAGLNLPPKVYTYYPFELTPKQRKVYDAFKKDFMVELDGHLITAPLALTRLTRLQQICSGYLPTDETRELVEIDPGKNPRLDVLVAQVEATHGQGLMWAAFRPDRDRIIKALGPERVICYRSDDSDRQKKAAIDSWRAGNSQFLLGHVKSGMARSWTFTEAEAVLYYSNLYFHGPRMQSEDRAHRIGQTKTVSYGDIISRNTMERDVVDALISKVEIAAETLGDKLRAWLK